MSFVAATPAIAITTAVRLNLIWSKPRSIRSLKRLAGSTNSWRDCCATKRTDWTYGGRQTKVAVADFRVD